MYGHRPPPPPMAPRYMELLELMKNEYEALCQDLSMSKMHREDTELKMHSQLVDISAMQRALYELERSHLRMKQHYEEEIARLKHELEERGGPVYVPGTSAAALIQFPTPPNLEAELQSFASGFTGIGGTPESTGASHMTAGGYAKRNYEEEPSHGRMVRPREDPYVAAMVHRPSAMQPPLAAAPPSSTSIPNPLSTSVPPQTATRITTAVLPHEPTKKEGPPSGFDWLVVYNPKAPRAITIDLLQTFLHENVVCCVRFSQDGKRLATGSNRVASVFDLQTGERLATLMDGAVDGGEREADQYIRSVAFSPDGKLLATGSEDQLVRIWDIERQELRAKLSGHTQDIYSVDFIPDGKILVSGSGDRTLRLWDVETGRCKSVLSIPSTEPAKEAGITSVAVSPNGLYVAAGSLDRTIRLWELETGKAVETLEGHRDSVYAVAFTLDGQHLISGSLDKTIKVWQFDSAEPVTRGQCKYTILGHKDFVLSVTCTPPDGRWIVSGSKDRSVQFWDSQTGTTQLMLQGHKNSVISVAVSPLGTVFATASGDCRARVWSYAPMGTTASGASGTGTIRERRSSASATGPTTIASNTGVSSAPVSASGSASSTGSLSLSGSGSASASALILPPSKDNPPPPPPPPSP